MEEAIIVTYEYVNGFQFKQRIERFNGKQYHECDRNSYEISNWVKANKETKIKELAKQIVLYNDLTMWENEIQKENAFSFVYEFISNKIKIGGSITNMLPFEIFLMSDGFELINFCELNAIDPIYRVYKKNDCIIYIGCGILLDSKRFVQFYFIINNKRKIYQVDNKKENYSDAINGKLKDLF
jgi:hypothetical protein